jgi:hypothetical protein
MKEMIVLFKKHFDTIENFLITTIENNSLESSNEANVKSAFKNMQSLQSTYLVDGVYKQVSPSFYPKNKQDNERIGVNKERYFSNVKFNEKSFYMSNPYLHYKTGKPSVTIVKKTEQVYVVFDVDLLMLLEELRLIEHNKKFDTYNKYLYALGGYLLSFVSIFLILYGAYAFIFVFQTVSAESMLHEIFKSIIAITLGLAIHDLAKTIISHEVLFRNMGSGEISQYHILGKFLVSIIIALSIESLMVVFKIVIDGKNYSAIQYAFYLILGVTIMIVGLAIFTKFTKEQNCE